MREADLPRYGGDPAHWAEVYHGLIVPAVTRAGLRPLRDDEDAASRLIVEDVLRKIEQAEVILCDLSSHNPNVYLELGWALRADKRFVLMIDDASSFSFDLNQFYHCKYGRSLQPTALAKSIEQLADTITQTKSTPARKYSLVSRLRLEMTALQAASDGNVEVGLLQEVLSEVRSLRRPGGGDGAGEMGGQSLNVTKLSDLPAALVGTTWRKRTGLEQVVFHADGVFYYNSAGSIEWVKNAYAVDVSTGHMRMTWMHDSFVSQCRFSAAYDQFVERGGNEPPWLLVASKPYVHRSFGSSYSDELTRAIRGRPMR